MKAIGALLTLTACCTAVFAHGEQGNPQHTSRYWYQQGQATLAEALALTPNTSRAKNVILFVGDGHGITSVTASRIFDGQSKGMQGEDNVLSFEAFPYVALSKTYNTNQQTPDSAGTMTAMMTGVKTSAGVLSIGPEATTGDCRREVAPVPTLLEQAQSAGLATGIVTTTRITHATPAATYAHSVHRDWESSADIPQDMKQCSQDIASQLVANGRLDVVLGGGRANFLPVGEPDPEYPDKTGKRGDHRNLVAAWQQANPGGAYVWNEAQFNAVPADFSGRILGLFEPSHMLYEADRVNEPSLSDMTRVAISRLSRNTEGFFLMVEAGRIDHGHHAGNAYRALMDSRELSNAVAVAAAATSADDTLIIVTADHSHVLTMAGYPTRGNPILGKVVSNDGHGRTAHEPALAADGKPYTTLSYMNGPGYGHFDSEAERYAGGINSGRHLKSTDDTGAANFHQEALVPMFAETHGGEDVAIYARGPWAHLFHCVHEQNYIYHVMRQALWPNGNAR
jgi:alkaline phosphatase